MTRVLIFVLILMLFPVSVTAQDTQTVFTVSGRASLELPETWVYRHYTEEEELEGLDSETLVFGTSHDVIDQYLNNEPFDGTVFFLSAYPYNVYVTEVLGDPVKMMTDVTVYEESEVTSEIFASFPGSAFYYDDPQFFVWDVLLDTGEMTYRGTVYSTRKDDFEQAETVVNSLQTFPVSLENTLDETVETRAVTTADSRLRLSIPENWLYWNETDNSVSFGSSGKAYEGLSYSFKPEANEELVFLVHRMVKSALRPDEVVDGNTDLTRIMQRLTAENDGLRKDTPLMVEEWQGIPRLDSAWLVKGAKNSVLTQTTLLDGQDMIYIVQAQYDPDKRSQLQPTVDRIFNSMNYSSPESYLDPSQEGLEPGHLAPEFTLSGLEGQEISLSEYRGKVIFMNLWASWCGPCHREAPDLQSYYEFYDGRFEILAVNVGETEIEAGGFVNQYGLTFPVLLDPTERVSKLYDLRGYPTTYIIGRDGVVLDVIVGSFSEQGLRDVLALYVG
ncbi:MAG: redoxin domain-containing protein, partial [Anaerolineae bacterium]|nr:redoxin domain-containing protein [Anaerolineae bacterium]